MLFQSICTTEVLYDKPDLIVHDKLLKKTTIMEFSVPWDSNVELKYNEKVTRYIPLAKLMKNVFETNTIRIQPIIFGCLGTTTKKNGKGNKKSPHVCSYLYSMWCLDDHESSSTKFMYLRTKLSSVKISQCASALSNFSVSSNK